MLAEVNPDGSPQTPECGWAATATAGRKHRNLEHERSASVTALDSDDPYDYAALRRVQTVVRIRPADASRPVRLAV